MSEPRRKDYESTVMRIAGNVAGQVMVLADGIDPQWIAEHSVRVARAIVAEVQRTAPESQS